MNKEIIDNKPTEKLMQVWEVYERGGPGCVAYLTKAQAENSDPFPSGNGYGKIVLAHHYVSANQLSDMLRGYPLYIA